MKKKYIHTYTEIRISKTDKIERISECNTKS